MTPPSRPDFSQIDAWGLTHAGRVRSENQDHFFVGALASGGVVVDETSTDLPEVTLVAPHADGLERLASLAVVADGVGGQSGGEEAARTVVQGLVTEVARSFAAVAAEEAHDSEAFARMLHDAALRCHETLRQRAEAVGTRPASTATLFLGLWPHAWLLQVGDSRCYIHQDGELHQLTRDQTWAQELIDSGAMTRTTAERSRWANVLSSAVGGDTTTPEVTRITRGWGDVVILCSDGLTKHVSDARLAERVRTMRSSRELCEALLDDALAGGGSDNVTVVVGRTLPAE